MVLFILILRLRVPVALSVVAYCLIGFVCLTCFGLLKGCLAFEVWYLAYRYCFLIVAVGYLCCLYWRYVCLFGCGCYFVCGLRLTCDFDCLGCLFVLIVLVALV